MNKHCQCEYCDGQGKITIPHASMYEEIMRKHFVIVDFDLRKLAILEQVKAELTKL